MDNRRRSLTSTTKEVPLNGAYTINLGGWKKSSKQNPDTNLYDGVYESYSNYNVHNSAATMTITINGLNTFTIYIRSNGESNYDYVMVSQLDKDINNSTTYFNTTLVKSHTYGKANSANTFNSYTKVEFTEIGGGTHKITIVYKKDGSSHYGDDKGYLFIDKNYEVCGDVISPIMVDEYLTIESLEDGLTATLYGADDCEYCVDGSGEWKMLTSNYSTESINDGQTLSFRGNLTPSTSSGIGTFNVDKKFNLKGNCMSMLFGDDGKTTLSLYGKNNAFRGLFRECTKLITVSKTFLPATTLSEDCYITMFYGCTNMISAPDLPAKKATNSCYRLMFNLCSSLAEAPSLPATTLDYACYESMFYSCKSLTIAPVLPSSFIAQNAYSMMFKNCTKLTTVPLLAASKYDSSLAGVGQCGEMFYGCTSLNYVKTNLTSFGTTYNRSWMDGVKSSGTFVAPSTVDTTNRGVNGIPTGWVIEFF